MQIQLVTRLLNVYSWTCSYELWRIHWHGFKDTASETASLTAGMCAQEKQERLITFHSSWHDYCLCLTLSNAWRRDNCSIVLNCCYYRILSCNCLKIATECNQGSWLRSCVLEKWPKSQLLTVFVPILVKSWYFARTKYITFLYLTLSKQLGKNLRGYEYNYIVRSWGCVTEYTYIYFVEHWQSYLVEGIYIADRFICKGQVNWPRIS